jgi:hypothetical protein
VADVVQALLDFHEKAVHLEILDDAVTALHDRPAEIAFRDRVIGGGLEGGIRDPAVVGEGLDDHEFVTKSDLPVVRIVRGRDLEGAGPEGHVDVGVGDKTNAAADQRKNQLFPDHSGVAFVLGMDRDGRIAQHRLGTRRRDDDLSGPVREGIADVPESALPLLVLDLDIRERGVTARAPVHQAVGAIDEPLAVESHEDLDHRAGKPFVHREPLARPVAGGAEPPQLPDDRPARLFLPLPDALDEGGASEVAARLPLLRQHLLDDVLGRDSGVIGARQPENIVAAHPVVAGVDVLDRIVERVSHVEGAGDVRRRNHHDEARLVGRGIGAERARLFPPPIPPIVRGGVVEAGLEFGLAGRVGHGGQNIMGERSVASGPWGVILAV